MSVLKYKDPVTGEWKKVGAGDVKIPSALPNPNKLTINGTEYDGSKEVDVDIKGALSGSTANVTPMQVAEALDAGMPVILSHTDDTYGEALFSGFMKSEDFGVVMASGIALYFGRYVLFELIGGMGDNGVWQLIVTELAQYSDIPTSLPSPNALKFTGAVTGEYDGSSEKTVNIPSAPSALPNPKKLTVNGTEYDGSKEVHVSIVGGTDKSVKTYGAVGDGSTDDTEAFRAALAAERVVFVPGGTYVLSGELIIRANCGLELSQDTVLKFTQTDENCISMLRSASLKGNHATIFVPYIFGANVINCDTGYDEAALEFDRTLTGTAYKTAIANANNVAVPPFTRWGPQWKMTRYITDINICKPDNRGFHYSKDGDCYGNGIYIHCDVADYVSYMWGVSMSGVRIAGGFNYGIRIYNIGETKYSWNHDMRIEAVIDACKVGVSVENCRYARLAVTVQPRRAYSDEEVYSAYAERGIELIDSRGVDLSSSRVWDWNETNTLWAEGNEYQHLALIGECMGLILDDYLYYAQGTYDIRDLIYTDKLSNLEQMTILQEPFTRYFKPVGGVPYFSDGVFEKRLVTEEELDEHFKTDVVKNFTDRLAGAIDTDGSIYNGKGYEIGHYLGDNGGVLDSAYYGVTGFIPCKKGDEIHAHDMSFVTGDDNCQITLYDANFNFVLNVNRGTLIKGNNYHVGYRETENGFVCSLNSVAALNNVAYVRFSIYKTQWGENPMVAVNEEIKYVVSGFLADGINVKGDKIVMSSPGGKSYRLIVSDSGALSTELIE